MKVSLWCASLDQPWSWRWLAYPGVWFVTILPLAAYLVAVRRHTEEPTSRRTKLAFMAAVLVFWAVSDWPVGTLGTGYLAWVHMAQYVVYTLVIAPLLLRGTPKWMAIRVLDHLHIRGLARRLTGDLVLSGVLFNLVLIVTHTPVAVDTLRASQLGSFSMDALWLVSGIILWAPILSPITEHRVRSAASQMVYLFVAAGVVAIVPASFLTFARFPLYATYELAPRVGSLTAIEDQQLAGIIMKLGMIPIVWTTLAVMFFRWAESERTPPA